MTRSKLNNWMRAFVADPKQSRAACIEGIEEATWLAERYEDKEYYSKVESPVIFLWGVAFRQPQIALQAVSDIVRATTRITSAKGKVREAFTVAVDGGDVTALTTAFGKVASMKYGNGSDYIDRMAYRLLRWRLGHARPVGMAESVRRCLAQHVKLTGGSCEFLPELRARIPFELWETGFGDSK